MTRFKILFAALVVTAIVGAVPSAHAAGTGTPPCFTGAANCHFVGAGSSAQFTQAGIAADQMAEAVATATSACTYHWSAKNAANVIDNRGTVAIPIEPGNIWIVWVAACSDTTGNTSVSDIWTDVSVDSTVGVRTFLAQNIPTNGGSGDAVEVIPQAAGNLFTVGSSNLWPDNKADVSLITASSVSAAIGTDQSGIKDVHINAGLTDIRPEDALYATTRAMAALNATLTGLGYNSTTNVGASILTSEGTGTKATPVKFAVTGTDPITHEAIRSYVTTPIGAAPIVFIYNNNGTAGAGLTNVVSGINGMGTAGSGYALAKLFDGTTDCDTVNAAFSPAATTTENLALFLREPLSGTMNTTEFSLFRTTGNTSDSQEKGVGGNSGGNNPLSALPCASGGTRSRAIGTGEVVGSSTAGVLGTPYGLGYIFYGFVNAGKFGGSANPTHYQYLTIDGVDPLGFAPGVYTGEANQNLPNCPGPCLVNTYWTNGISYPHLRDGSYGAWSIYRWLTPTDLAGESDPYGPAHLAQAAQNTVDDPTVGVADFVPFSTTSGPTDGLTVYHSHFTQSGKTCSYTGTLAQQECNGPATATENYTTPSGNSLGGEYEVGGDMGGVIIGWDYSTVTTAAVTIGACHTAHATKVSKTAGRAFGFSSIQAGHTAGIPADLETAYTTVDGQAVTVSTCIAPTATILYVTGYTGTIGTGHQFAAYIAPTGSGTLGGDNGVIGKKR